MEREIRRALLEDEDIYSRMAANPSDPSDPSDLSTAVDTLSREVVRLRKTVLKLGHAQELFQGRIEEAVERLVRRPEGSEAPARSAGREEADLTPVQLRVLIELDQAVLHLLAAANSGEDGTAGPSGEEPQSVREGLALLQIRVRNLQRSFGLEPIPTVGAPFDDQVHEAQGVCEMPGIGDGVVAAEVLPGYRLRGRVVRPARVVVNRKTNNDKETT
jgi:molecular chaperone GrpE